MNHCRNCNSDYEQPGTCNCFAPQRAQITYPPYVPSLTVPWYPQSWPIYPNAPFWSLIISPLTDGALYNNTASVPMSQALLATTTEPSGL